MGGTANRRSDRKIQMLRAAAIAAVVLIHTNADGIVAVVDRPFLNFAVALFLFLSGYLTKARIPDLKRFYRRRLLRVMIPYSIWTVAYAVYLRDFLWIPHYLATGTASAQLYYCLVYAQLVLLTPLSGRLLLSKAYWLGWLVTPTTLLLVRYLPILIGLPVGFPFPETAFLSWFGFYYLGMALGNGVVRWKTNGVFAWAIYGASILLSIGEGLFWYSCGNMDMATTQLRLTSLMSSTFACLCAYCWLADAEEPSDGVFSRIIVSIGDCSFGIFFGHVLVLRLLSRIPFWEDIAFPLTSCSVFGVSLLISLAGRRVFGKYAGYLGFE